MNYGRGSRWAHCPRLPSGTATRNTCAPFLSSNDTGYYSAVGLLILSLSACTSKPIVRVQYVNIPTYIPYPETLTQPISVDLTGDTWGKAVGDLKAGLEACNGNLGAVAGLKPPP